MARTNVEWVAQVSLLVSTGAPFVSDHVILFRNE